jgi:hypothetical protein
MKELNVYLLFRDPVNADCDLYCYGIVTLTVLKTLSWKGGKEAG